MENTTGNRKSNDKINERAIGFLEKKWQLRKPDLDTTGDAITEPTDAVRIMKRYEEIIKTQNKIVICYVGKQGQLLN